MTPKKLSKDKLEGLANRFKALSQVSRLQIIAALQTGEKSVNDLALETGLSQPNVSKHLQLLAHAGLIGRRRSGTAILCFVIDESLFELCSIVCKQIQD